ncbi:MAG: hypothetical protein HOP30_15900 [Cyclobacteriaceae bacterium]|nr:hypothetical protein [Cyclobacteriaceae bacterium]
MKINIAAILILALQSCSELTCDWSGGVITDYGSYCNNDLKIKVYEDSNYLRYEVLNQKGNVVIKTDMNISKFQRWGLFLDEQKNLWVLSSDVGDAVWKLDSSTGRYNKKMFHYYLTKDSVPRELYNSKLKYFIK